MAWRISIGRPAGTVSDSVAPPVSQTTMCQAPTAADTEWNVNGSRRCRMRLRMSASRLAVVIVALRLPVTRELRRHANVFAARTLRALAEVKRHGLPFTQIIEMRL